MAGIKVTITNDDAFQISADCLVLKYAQATYGLDRDIVREFEIMGSSIENKLPAVNSYFLTDSKQVVNAKKIIFIGVLPLRAFDYKEIREFGQSALVALAKATPATKTIAMTIHGPGYGLDEIEAFESQLAGIVDSIASDNIPPGLNQITFVERSPGRAKRLQQVLKELFPEHEIPKQNTGYPTEIQEATTEILRTAGSDRKKSIFVAMPFDKAFNDHYHYGIQGAVNACGYLCERADLQSFDGDVMTFVKERIANAHFVIADLTTANPNVYLEVGYAWGLKKRTILVIQDTKELKFDTRGQRCLPYASITELEAKLKAELTNLGL